MIIRSAQFVISAPDVEKCPLPDKPEYAFIGRSNVGKSSLINMLTSQKGMAKTSSTPVKTQLINHFIINEEWYLVDLPGYGFAKVSKEAKSKWDGMIKNYLTKRTNLMNVFVLVDSRLEPQKIDLEFINWLGGAHVPLTIVFTKADKQTSNKTHANVEVFKKELMKSWHEMPPYFITSSETRSGKELVMEYIEQCNPLFNATE